MGRYSHLAIEEREDVMCLRRQGGVCEIARAIGRDKSTASGEFSARARFTEAVGAERCFCLPHHPWQRGANENTNGLLRQYFPKRCDLGAVTDEEVAMVCDELNRRPRERLGWRTPYEVYHSVALHLL